MGYERFMAFNLKKSQKMCDMYSYRKVKFDIKIRRRCCDSYVFLDKSSPCLMKDVYEILILFFWLPQGIEHHNSGPIDLDREQDPVEAVEIEVMKRS